MSSPRRTIILTTHYARWEWTPNAALLSRTPLGQSSPDVVIGTTEQNYLLPITELALNHEHALSKLYRELSSP